jgi:hypothetical protein
MTCCVRLEIQTENSQVSGKLVSFLAKSVLDMTKRNSINMDFVISLSPRVIDRKRRREKNYANSAK